MGDVHRPDGRIEGHPIHGRSVTPSKYGAQIERPTPALRRYHGAEGDMIGAKEHLAI